MSRTITKKSMSVGIALVMASMQLAGAIPDLEQCSPIGSTSTGDVHTYEGFLSQNDHSSPVGTRPLVYDQCLSHILITLFTEFGAGFGASAFASVASSHPYNDFRLGGTKNCWDYNFDAHHGPDDTIHAADLVAGGNIVVLITADVYDDSGESVLDEAGVDVRDPCGDRSIGDNDLLIVSPPCGANLIGVPNCAANSHQLSSSLAASAGLDGGVWVYYASSAGGIVTSGTAWTSQS